MTREHRDRRRSGETERASVPVGETETASAPVSVRAIAVARGSPPRDVRELPASPLRASFALEARVVIVSIGGASYSWSPEQVAAAMLELGRAACHLPVRRARVMTLDSAPVAQLAEQPPCERPAPVRSRQGASVVAAGHRRPAERVSPSARSSALVADAPPFPLPPVRGAPTPRSGPNQGEMGHT